MTKLSLIIACAIVFILSGFLFVNQSNKYFSFSETENAKQGDPTEKFANYSDISTHQVSGVEKIAQPKANNRDILEASVQAEIKEVTFDEALLEQKETEINSLIAQYNNNLGDVDERHRLEQKMKNISEEYKQQVLAKVKKNLAENSSNKQDR